MLNLDQVFDKKELKFTKNRLMTDCTDLVTLLKKREITLILLTK